jgi:hypothetical protein
MSNTQKPVPATPAELLALNELRQAKEADLEEGLGDDPKAFAYAVTQLQEDFSPSPVQSLMAAIQLVEQLKAYHHETIENAEDMELSAYQVEIWKEDYQALKVALQALRQVDVG